MTESVLSAFADGRIRVAAATGLSVVVIIFVIRVNSCRFVIKHKTKTPSGFAVATALWAVRNPHVTAHRAVATTFVFLRVN